MGYNHEKQTSEFTVNVFIDHINKRVKVKDYLCTNFNSLAEYLELVALDNNLDKIIMVVKEDDWQEFFVRGFVLEAIHPSYFLGKPGYHLSKFLSNERRNMKFGKEEDDIIKQVLEIGFFTTKELRKQYQIRTATVTDIPMLVTLFTTVFESYPTPVHKPEYLEEIMCGRTVFKIVLDGNHVVSAASLDIDKKTESAELTDCATLPEYRGQSLMQYLVADLEEYARKVGLITVYTIARANLKGINTVFARLGYKYYGRFIKNCDICGQFEDMNLWSKRL